MQQPDAYVVIGNPVGHSKSPWIHAAFAAQTAQQMQYSKLEAPLDDFAGAVHRLMDSGARGANVTVPFKLEAFALADSMTARARRFGRQLQARFGLPVLFVDERLSSVEAERDLREAGRGGRKNKHLVHAESARIILQDYLDESSRR